MTRHTDNNIWVQSFMMNAHATRSQDDQTSRKCLTWTKICENRTKSRWTAQSLDLMEYFWDSKHSFCNFTPRKVKINLVLHCFLSNRNRSPIIFQMPETWKRSASRMSNCTCLFQHRIIPGTFNIVKSHSATSFFAVSRVLDAFCWFRCFLSAA